MGLPTTEEASVMGPKLVSLREKLGQKAKQEPGFRFYTLYGLIYREDVLRAAWNKVHANRGASGVDGLTFADIQRAEGGVEAFLQQIASDLKEKTYKPQPVRRVYIPKPDGKKRPLGIPTIRDRVVQTATLLILEPIFEADFLDCSYGCRPGRNAHQVVGEIEANLKQGYREVYDADLQGYFDSIPHDKLMKCLEMRIVDRHLLRLIRMWLEVPIVEEDEDGKTRIQRPKSGIPQGGCISPLLANLYLHWFDKVFHNDARGARYGAARLLRYVDDLIIMARKLRKETVEFIEEKLEKWMGLKINRTKTRTVDMKEQGALFSFLGFSYRYDRSKFWEGTYLNIFPMKKAEGRARERIREITGPGRGCRPHQEVIRELNLFLCGWGQYFDLGYPTKVFDKLNHFVGFCLYRHLLRKSQKRKFLTGEHSWYAFFKKCGLTRLRKRMSAKAFG